MHDFVVVGSLVMPVILGVDFLHGNALVLDFTNTPVNVQQVNSALSAQSESQFTMVQIGPIYEASRNTQVKVCAIAAVEQLGADVVDECVVPMYQKPANIELPNCTNSGLLAEVQEYKCLFKTTTGVTNAVYHFIPIISNPLRVFLITSLPTAGRKWKNRSRQC